MPPHRSRRTEKIEVIETTKGKPLAILNGHLYRRVKWNPATTDATWACLNEKKFKCKGRMVIKEETIIRRIPHSCKPSNAKAEVTKRIWNARMRLKEEPESVIRDVYEEELLSLAKNGEEFASEIPTYSSVKSSLYRSKLRGQQSSEVEDSSRTLRPKVSQARQKWKNLKDTYRKMVRKTVFEKEVDQSYEPKWPYYDAMNFLYKTIVPPEPRIYGVEVTKIRTEDGTIDSEAELHSCGEDTDMQDEIVVVKTEMESENEIKQEVESGEDMATDSEGLDPDDVEAFVREVFKRTALWDKNHSQHHHAGALDKLWSEIGRLYNNKKSIEMRVKWKYLKDTYRRELKRSVVGGKEHQSSWPHFEAMSFLKEQMSHQYPPAPSNPQEPQFVDVSQLVSKKETLDDRIEDGNSNQKEEIHQENDDNDGDDYHFFMSLIPHMKNLSSVQKLRIRSKIQNIVIEEISGGTN